MSAYDRKAGQFLALVSLLALIACGVWFALKYLRHEREEGSAIRQLRRIGQEAQKGGWIKDSNGAWGLPVNIGTNTTASKRRSGETNKGASSPLSHAFNAP